MYLEDCPPFQPRETPFVTALFASLHIKPLLKRDRLSKEMISAKCFSLLTVRTDCTHMLLIKLNRTH